MFRVGLIGKGIGHSKLFEFYRTLIPAPSDYVLLNIKNEEDLPPLSELAKTYQGINITTPYKRSYCNQAKMDSWTEELGAINCLSLRGGEFRACNVDYFALRDIYFALRAERNFEHIFILGSGVMSQVTQQLFDRYQTPYRVLARAPGDDISSMDFAPYKNALVINACSREFVFSGRLNQGSLFWDYNYDFTPHQRHFEQAGQVFLYRDGLELLHRQGYYSLFFWEIFS